MNKILDVRDVVIKFDLRGKVLTPVRGASLELYEGETLAVVGESGSGKSVFTKSFVGMLDKNGWVDSGQIMYEGVDIAGYKSEKEWLSIRGKKIGMIFQDPMTALNPLKTIGEQIREIISLHQGLDHKKAKDEAIEILKRVGINDAELRYSQYPHEFSGGMRQRVVIAAAIACKPQILISDEPTTALDVTIQAKILKLLKELQKELHMSMIFITHDLGVVANIADRVAVMYAGEIVEHGLVTEIFREPKHAYTCALLSSLPQLGVKGEDLYSIKGTPPNLFNEIKGDAFAPRNPRALKIDYLEAPPFYRVTDTHYAKTWLLNEKAPKVDFNGFIEKDKDIMRAEETKPEKKEVLLSLRDVSVEFKLGKSKFKAVSDVNFDIYKGETFSLVGESGSGKTTIGRVIMKIHEASKGDIFFNNEKINGRLSSKKLKELRQNIQMIFQDPMASLNERAKVDYIISEGLYNFNLYKDEKDRKEKVDKALESVGLFPEFASRFPHEFSGGQRQRIGIARSIIMQPEFIIADEPISALDVSIRAQIINLLNKLKKDYNLTYLFIAHDLSVVRFISDRIAVIHKGKIVELAESEELYTNPIHPYTKALLSAIPVPDPDKERSKKLYEYNPAVHDYEKNPPRWHEVNKGHFILANDQEIEAYSRK